jgi:hypothetical protein
MIIYYGNNGVVFDDSYDYKEQIKKVGGRWVQHLGVWYVQTVSPETTIKAFFDSFENHHEAESWMHAVSCDMRYMVGDVCDLVHEEAFPPATKEWWK